MGKWANQKRRELFEKLKESGQLDKPLYVRKPRVYKKRTKGTNHMIQAQADEQAAKCCMIKHGDLPNGFKPCHGCPLDTSVAA